MTSGLLAVGRAAHFLSVTRNIPLGGMIHGMNVVPLGRNLILDILWSAQYESALVLGPVRLQVLRPNRKARRAKA